jgi:hypothetical protein
MPFVPDQTQPSGHFVPDAPTPNQSTSPQFTGKPSDWLQAGQGVMRLMDEPRKILASALGGGAATGPISDVAGLADIPAHMAGLTQTTPEEMKQKVGQGISQAAAPMSSIGQAIDKYNPMNLIGRGVEALAKKGESLVAPPKTSGPLRSALGYGVKGAIEQAPNVIGALAGKRAGESFPERQAALDAEKKLNEPRDDLAHAADAAGYIRPSEKGMKAAASGIAGKAKEEKTLTLHNEKNAEARLGSEVGIPDGEPPTADARESAEQAQVDKYKAMVNAAGPRLQVTNQVRDAVSSTLSKINEKVGTAPELTKTQSILKGFLKKLSPNDPAIKEIPGKTKTGIFQTIEKTAVEQPFNLHAKRPVAPGNILRTLEQTASESPGPHAYGSPELAPSPTSPVPTPLTPTVDTRWVMEQISDLRRFAKNDKINRDWAAYDARMGLSNQLENLIEDNLNDKNKPLVGQFRQARVTLAKLHLLDAIADDATGRINLQKLAQLSQKPQYRGSLTGEFKLAADFARAYKKAAAPVTGEAIPRFTVLDGLFAASGATSALLGHPGGLGVAAGEIGARLAVPALARRGMLRNPVPTYQAGYGGPSAYPLLGAALSGNQIAPPPQQ